MIYNIQNFFIEVLLTDRQSITKKKDGIQKEMLN